MTKTVKLGYKMHNHDWRFVLSEVWTILMLIIDQVLSSIYTYDKTPEENYQ